MIPADTTVVYHIGTVMKDMRYLNESEKFNPERFLDKNGKFFQPSELMSFGVGKRSCLGGGLVRLELFLFMGNIFNKLEVSVFVEKFVKLQLFQITRDPTNPPDLRRINGVTIQSEPFVFHVKKRY